MVRGTLKKEKKRALLRPPALLSLGALATEHRTIYSKPEIRTVLMKRRHPAVPHMHAMQL